MKVGETMNQECVNKVLIDPSIPIEELLGSVTTYNSVEGSDTRNLQVRTSARVFKKMKLDLAAVPSTEKKDEVKSEQQKKEEAKPEAKTEPKPEARRPLTRPLWTQEDKNLFFEGLNEYGKDFDAIHLYISNKLKKKGIPEYMIKSKDQVRHLFYQTWHKISKHLKFSSEVKKIVQELYGLINYGEIRKKLTSVSEKTLIKLNQLIYSGSLVLRVKGKNIRIKTPMCKALRRLNQLDENSDDMKLPTRISVEMRPKDMMTWMRVQDVSQNPRIKAVLPLQKRLSTVLAHLSERWKPQEVLEQGKLLSTADQLPVDDEKILDNVKLRMDSPLRLCPPSDAVIMVPTVNLSELLSAQSICLSAFEERTGVKVSGEHLWLQAYPNLNKSCSKKGVKRPRTESATEKLLNSLKLLSASSTDNNSNCVTEADHGGTHSHKQIIDEAVSTILALQHAPKTEEVAPEKSETIKIEEDALMSVKKEQDMAVKKEHDMAAKKEHDMAVKKEHDMARIKLGWTMSDCGMLTVGDLYLMFGSDSKVVLEYGWDVPETVVVKKEPDTAQPMDVDGDSPVERSDNSDCKNNLSLSNNSDSLSVTLRRLLSLAKLHYRKNMIRCPCGHICNGPKKEAPTRNKSTPRMPKPSVANVDIKLPTELQILHPTTTIINLPQNNVTTTARLVPVIMQQELQNFSPTTLFRSPDTSNGSFRAQLDSITRLKTRYCNRRGRRPRQKQVVVERRLSLLPNKAENDRQIVTMNIVSKDISAPRQIAPKIVPQIMTTVCSIPGGVRANGTYVESTLTPMSVTSNGATGAFGIVPLSDTVTSSPVGPDILDNATTPSRVGSPTSISNLLDMALQSHEDNGISLDQSRIRKDGPISSFEGLLSDNIGSSISISPTSPSRILKENENQWLNSEVADFSLSSFLGHLESPMKIVPSSSNIGNEDSRLALSQDVDAHLQSLLTESSMDLTAKFADLAAQVSDNKK